MHRALQVATIAAVLAVTSTAHAEPAKIHPKAHLAALTESQAEAVAQSRQDQECGRGGDWWCENKRWPEAMCYQGYNRWECSGGVRQVGAPWNLKHAWGYRSCGIYITVAQGVATLRDNSCF